MSTEPAPNAAPPDEPDGWSRGRFIVLGMTYPHYSEKYAENVCTGAIDMATGRLVRIHPVPQRYLEPGARFHTFQEITARFRPHDVDPRPESIRIDPVSIETGRTVTPDERAERAKWLRASPHLFSSVEELHDRWRSERASLGIIQPRAIVGVRLERRPPSAAAEWAAKAERVHRQTRLPTMQPVKPIDFPDTRFMVAWECNDSRCRGHEMGLEDWGMHELWRKLKGDPERNTKLVDAMQTRLDLAKGDVFLYLGNFLSVRWNFGLMGVCFVKRPKSRQLDLFGAAHG